MGSGVSGQEANNEARRSNHPFPQPDPLDIVDRGRSRVCRTKSRGRLAAVVHTVQQGVVEDIVDGVLEARSGCSCVGDER